MSNIILVAVLVLIFTYANPGVRSTVFQCVSSISCYACDAPDAETCKKTQKGIPCDSNRGEDTCMTVSYKDTFLKNDRYVQQTYMSKSCVPRNNSCPLMCTLLEETGNTDCKGTCCHENLCNGNVEEKDVFHDYFKNGSGIHDDRGLVIVAFVHIVSTVSNYWFTS